MKHSIKKTRHQQVQLETHVRHLSGLTSAMILLTSKDGGSIVGGVSAGAGGRGALPVANPEVTPSFGVGVGPWTIRTACTNQENNINQAMFKALKSGSGSSPRLDRSFRAGS